MSVCFATGTIAKMLQVTALSLAWTHSVEKIEWQEDWRITPGGLELVSRAPAPVSTRRPTRG